jgi:CDGSH-type Zn-finger protein
MTSPMVAQKSPYPIEVKSGRIYYWCACGRSNKQPFCDGFHSGTSFLPKPYRPEKDGTAWFCGCKHSQKSPLCDGAHKGSNANARRSSRVRRAPREATERRIAL